jgi:hypothetical protein
VLVTVWVSFLVTLAPVWIFMPMNGTFLTGNGGSKEKVGVPLLPISAGWALGVA